MSSSRPYKITARQPLQNTATANDSVHTTIEVIDVLPPGQTAAVLAGVLREHGFDDDGGKMVREEDGVRVEVDPGTGGVTVSAEESADMPPEEKGGGGCTCAARLRQKAAEAAREAAEKGLQARVTGRLERALGPLGCELEKIAHKATGKALVQSARQVGELKRIEHDNQTGAVTIIVEVPG